MNKKSHEEELQEHINALEAKLEEEVKENIKHLGDLRYYEEVQIPELQKQLAEARAEIERKNEELDMFLAEQQAMNKIIARKDKLIEQMREALRAWVRTPNIPLHEAIKLTEAALEAAERAE